MSDKISILVVDDNPSITRTMGRILQRLGYKITTATSGVEALEVVKKDKSIDIVFMDIKMPVMNGVETYKKIKTIKPEAIVIMMTAYAVDKLIQEAIEEGAYGVIHKPMDFDKVVELIQGALTNPKGGLILVVDDDPSFTKSFQNVLENKGYQTIAADSGETAIELAREKEFDVMFIDMKLPSINGLEAYLRIKQIDSSAVAVIITAYADDLDTLVDQALQHSAYTCLQKPINLEDVIQVTEKIISKRNEKACN